MTASLEGAAAKTQLPSSAYAFARFPRNSALLGSRQNKALQGTNRLLRPANTDETRRELAGNVDLLRLLQPREIPLDRLLPLAAVFGPLTEDELAPRAGVGRHEFRQRQGMAGGLLGVPPPARALS